MAKRYIKSWTKKMGYATRIDWYEEQKSDRYYDKWVNHGRNIAGSSCKHKDHDSSKQNTNMEYSGYCEKCGYSEDSCIPMMNFIYPLVLTDFDEDKIKKVIKHTNCTVMENTETGEWFLTLCGGGMDLSQDIALAYHLLERWIPYDLAREVCTQKELSVGGKNWNVLKKAMLESLKLYRDRAEEKIKLWGAK